MPLPRYVQIEPVGQCNLRCRMCPIQFRMDGPPYGPPAYMPIETFRRLVDQFEGLAELHLQGLGEPMLHPRFFDMVAYAAGKGITVSTNSNMTLLTDGRAERCVTSGLAWLHVSIDGATAATYEAIRVRGRLDRVLRNVERVLSARRRLGSPTPRLRLVMVVMRRNLDELPDVVRLAARLGVDAMFVQRLSHDFGESSLPADYRPMREFVDRETLAAEDPARVERVFAEARRVAGDLSVDLRLPRAAPRPHPPGTPGRARCDWPFAGAYVSYDGLAMPCCMVATPDRIHFGSMAAAGVRAIWEGPAYEGFRARLDSQDPPEVCRSCALYAGTF